MTRSTDALGKITAFTYNAQKNLASVTDPLSRTTRLSYDPAGNLTQVLDANGHVTQFQYDARNLLQQVENPLGAVKTFAYDGDRNLIQGVDFKGQTTRFSYDNRNELTTKTTVTGTTSYAYDGRGRLTTATKSNATMTLSYDGLNEVTAENVGMGNFSTNETFAYDAVGNRTSMTDPAGTHTYAYDPLNRLTSALHPNQPAESYRYDPVGNRTRSQRSASYTYDAANRLLADDTFAYRYDANGNLTSKTNQASGEKTTYAYDGEDVLVEVQHFPPRSATPDTTVTFGTDPFGRRVSASTIGASGAQSLFYAYEDSQPIAMVTAQGSCRRQCSPAPALTR